MTTEYFRERWLAEKRRIKGYIDAAVKAVEENDWSAFSEAFSDLHDECQIRQACKVLMKCNASEEMRNEFALFWIENGDSIRNAVQNDLDLIEFLKVFLPRYEGPSITLYRGDSFFNRRRRTYGMSWTSSESIAESFAVRYGQTHTAGAVLLGTDCPASAIIWSAQQSGDPFEEQEFLVDRRRLGSVSVVKRFPAISPAAPASFAREPPEVRALAPLG